MLICSSCITRFVCVQFSYCALVRDYPGIELLVVLISCVHYENALVLSDTRELCANWTRLVLLQDSQHSCSSSEIDPCGDTSPRRSVTSQRDDENDAAYNEDDATASRDHSQERAVSARDVTHSNASATSDACLAAAAAMMNASVSQQPVPLLQPANLPQLTPSMTLCHIQSYYNQPTLWQAYAGMQQQQQLQQQQMMAAGHNSYNSNTCNGNVTEQYAPNSTSQQSAVTSSPAREQQLDNDVSTMLQQLDDALQRHSDNLKLQRARRGYKEALRDTIRQCTQALNCEPNDSHERAQITNRHFDSLHQVTHFTGAIIRALTSNSSDDGGQVVGARRKKLVAKRPQFESTPLDETTVRKRLPFDESALGGISPVDCADDASQSRAMMTSHATGSSESGFHESSHPSQCDDVSASSLSGNQGNRDSGHSNGDNSHSDKNVAHSSSDSGHSNDYSGHSNNDSGHSNNDSGHSNNDSGHNNADNGHSSGGARHSNDAGGHSDDDDDNDDSSDDESCQRDGNDSSSKKKGRFYTQAQRNILNRYYEKIIHNPYLVKEKDKEKLARKTRLSQRKVSGEQALLNICKGVFSKIT